VDLPFTDAEELAEERAVEFSEIVQVAVVVVVVVVGRFFLDREGNDELSLFFR
jgi:hypothetical protein